MCPRCQSLAHLSWLPDMQSNLHAIVFVDNLHQKLHLLWKSPCYQNGWLVWRQLFFKQQGWGEKHPVRSDGAFKTLFGKGRTDTFLLLLWRPRNWICFLFLSVCRNFSSCGSEFSAFLCNTEPGRGINTLNSVSDGKHNLWKWELQIEETGTGAAHPSPHAEQDLFCILSHLVLQWLNSCSGWRP